MKKEHTIVVCSILIIVVAIVLLINKSSYAVIISMPDLCPEQIKVNISKENLSLIKTSYTTISLPKSINLTNSNETYLNEEGIHGIRNQNVHQLEGKTLFLYSGVGEILSVIPKFSKNKEENRYYTQLALWWLIDKTSGLEDEYNYTYDSEEPLPIEKNENEKYDEDGNYKYINQLSALEKKAIKESPNGKKITKFIENVEQLMNSGQSSSTIIENDDSEQMGQLNPIDPAEISYHVTNDYIETELITPTAKDPYSLMFREYEVNVSSPITVVDENGKEKTTFDSLEGFRLRIPVSEIKENKINFKAEIIGKMRVDQWGMYTEKSISVNLDETRQIEWPNAVLMNCGTWETYEAFYPLELNYDVAVGNLNIKVIDAESKEELKDAEIVIYDATRREVYRYHTTGSELNITLPIGNYTVKQIVTPPNYQARITEQKIEITENSNTTATLENIQLISVPDTLKTATNITILGVIVTLIGLATIIITYSTKRKQP
ncbi:MAG: SpaA isopeptide-forming pilin-related protein [bacterium]|nr:SpaA isopeptide-forming pilin-related protein [bacterium]